VPDHHPNASSHRYSNPDPWLLDPSILRINQVDLLFLHIHLPGNDPSPHDNQHVHDPSVLRINRTVLLLVCLQLPGSIHIHNSAVLPVDRHLLLPEELRVPSDELGGLVTKHKNCAGLHVHLQTVLLDVQAVLLQQSLLLRKSKPQWSYWRRRWWRDICHCCNCHHLLLVEEEEECRIAIGSAQAADCRPG
jgi:hypothetical protein